jgi:hypothetical protein
MYEHNEAVVAWLEDGLRLSLAQGKVELCAYLEAVIEEVIFEMELAAPSPPIFGVSEA